MIPWLLSEYLLKGIFLGLLLFVALQQPDLTSTVQVIGCTILGLVIFLGVSARRKVKEGYRIKGRVPAFLLFLVLESPGLVYAGIIGGLFLGALIIRQPDRAGWLLPCFLGGAVLGLILWLIRHVRHPWVRWGLSLALGASLVAGVLLAVYFSGDAGEGSLNLLNDSALRTSFAVQLLLGIPLFYLLTFSGVAEESEVDVAAMCAALGLGMWMLVWDYRGVQSIGLLVIMMSYLFYTKRVLGALRTFKHVIRGISHANVGRYRDALLAFRRALQLDPSNKLAQESMWGVHRAMDLTQLADDPDTLALVDMNLCVERAGSLLMAAGPTQVKLEEAHHLLNMVETQRPLMQPVIAYWRGVAHLHERRYEEAAASLEKVLDSTRYSPGDVYRDSILFQAWQLALTLHPEMKDRVGTPQFAIPGRRMEAIGAVEKILAENAEDAVAWELKRILYSGLTESEYHAGLHLVTRDEGVRFDHAYTQQLGHALINDPAQWPRGIEYLRITVHGMPSSGPGTYTQIAQAYQQHGRNEEAWQAYDLVKQTGRAVGHKSLPDQDRQAYFAALKLLGEEARAKNDFDAAIEDYNLYSEYERSGVETLRILAELYEGRGDPLNAVRITEQALLYDGKNKEFLEKKDKYYYSVTPENLKAHLDAMKAGFDVEYCLRKAKSLLDYKDADAELIPWAQHLLQLAGVVAPDRLEIKVLRSRALRRMGDMVQSQRLLEEVYTNKPERFASGADEEAWFLASRLLGEMYLYDLNKPEQAIPCFNDFRKSAKSGADTMYKLGQAYEQTGDKARAARCYEHVTAYENHPLARDAKHALSRLQSR